jgi:serine protease Do
MTRIQTVGLAFSLLICTTQPLLAQADRGKNRIGKLFSEAVSAVSPSTVRIQCNDRDASLGTVVSSDGYILTKGSELRGEISVLLSDGTAYEAKYVGYHKESDLALIKIDADGLKPATFSDKNLAVVGNWVAVTGTGSDPISVGVISAAARKLYSQEALIENGNKGVMGIQMKVNDNTEIQIIAVSPDTGASRAGLKTNDVILTVAGKEVSSLQMMQELLDSYKPGDSLMVKIRRGEEEMMIKVRLGSRADVDRGSMQNQMGGQLSGRRTGFPSVIQHDTVISPINCGGPLVDLDGKVLGINIARAGRVETWTLPVSVVNPILRDLMAGKHPAPISTTQTKK